jgi:hypothetical protein
MRFAREAMDRVFADDHGSSMHFGSGILMQQGGNKEIIAKRLLDWQLTIGDDSMEWQRQREKCWVGFHLVPNLGFCT